MKEFLLEIIGSNPDPIRKRNLVREYLQARILEVLQRSGAMVPLAFQGGTALYFLYNIARFSEDLDFTLERPAANYDFRSYLKEIQSIFVAEGYNLQIKVNDQKTVNSAFIRFYGLLYELKLSPQPTEALSVKIEVDTNPPKGAGLETDLVRRYIPLNLQHHDRASLLAGKLHAILQREYAKGRDLYDLMWYLSDPLVGTQRPVVPTWQRTRPRRAAPAAGYPQGRTSDPRRDDGTEYYRTSKDTFWICRAERGKRPRLTPLLGDPGRAPQHPDRPAQRGRRLVVRIHATALRGGRQDC